MLLLVKNVRLFAPEPRGAVDILMGGPGAGGRVLAVAPGIDAVSLPLPCEVLDGAGLVAAPGLVDNHVHAIGGGGEGGWSTRTPELRLEDAVLAGATTVVGVLGTDGVARSMESLVAKVLALREEGISAWCYTGSYRYPPRTVTGDAMRDIMLVEPVIGVGELAVSDHRSSKPSDGELARLAAEARVGGMLSGKAGVLNLHMGDAPAGFEPLRRLIAGGDLPIGQLLPTHCARNGPLFAEALDWVRAGGWIDLTAGAPAAAAAGELSAAAALAAAKAAGVPLSRICVSSDGQGSLPVFDAEGSLAGIGVASCSSLLAALREAIDRGLGLAEALPAVTENPARALKLPRKGRIEPGWDADLVLLEPEGLEPRAVVAGGRIMARDGAMAAGAR